MTSTIHIKAIVDSSGPDIYLSSLNGIIHTGGRVTESSPVKEHICAIVDKSSLKVIMDLPGVKEIKKVIEEK